MPERLTTTPSQYGAIAVAPDGQRVAYARGGVDPSAPPGPGGLHFYPQTPCRIADTRNPAVYPFTRLTDRRIRVGIVGVPGVPASATAAVLTVTVGAEAQAAANRGRPA